MTGADRDNSPLWWAYKAKRARTKADAANAYADECERRYEELIEPTRRRLETMAADESSTHP